MLPLDGKVSEIYCPNLSIKDATVVILIWHPTDFQEMLEALKSLSTIFTENNLRNRRNLRGDIERRSLVINQEFVDSFRVVKEVLLIN